MTSVDLRTRHAGDAVALDASWIVDGLPAVLRETGRLAGRGVEVLALSTLGFEVDGVAGSLVARDGGLVVEPGSADDGPLAVMDAAAFSDLVQDVASTFGLTLSGRVEMRRGTGDDFVAWEPVLRAAFDERPVHESGAITFRALDGGELDIERSFRIDDPPEEVGHFLAEAGFLHLEGVFTEAEMDAVSAELDVALTEAARDDGASWWARTEAGGWYPSRVLGFNLKSPSLQTLLASDRFRSVGGFTGDELVQRPPSDGDSAEGLYKKVGVVEGISDVSWHKDCSLGDHTRRCCGLVVGISLTDSDAESGELGVVAGSHRANLQQTGIRGELDLPRLPLATRAGDLTVHCSCTLHMSRPPVSRERRVVYTGFDLAPRTGDLRHAADDEAVRRDRAALDAQVRTHQRRADFGRDHDQFTLPAKD